MLQPYESDGAAKPSKVSNKYVERIKNTCIVNKEIITEIKVNATVTLPFHQT
jgi:hypothetical protein